MLKSIAVEKFRNLNKVKLNFSRNVNIIVGDNGQGKTNLLEAIYLLSYAKSFRANKSQIINWQADWARIAGLTDKDEIEIRLLRDQETQAFINKKKKRVTDLLGRFVSVIFYPEEIGMISGPPNLRRSWLDKLGSITSKRYLRDLVDYQKSLLNKNKILKSPDPDPEQIEIWNKNLAKLGTRIWQARQRNTEEINRTLEIYSVRLLKQRVLIEYTSPTFNKREQFTEAAYFRTLNLQRGLERKFRVTLFGPHRDDFRFVKEEASEKNILKKNLGPFGSRAEQRQAVILLGFVEAKILTDHFGQTPTLVLDDAGSELDENNRALLFEHLPAGQIFISTTSLDLLPGTVKRKGTIFRVDKGTVNSLGN